MTEQPHDDRGQSDRDNPVWPGPITCHLPLSRRSFVGGVGTTVGLSSIGTGVVAGTDDEIDDYVGFGDGDFGAGGFGGIAPVTESGLAAYASEDGIIETPGLRDAVDDWRVGDIETELLRDVVSYWRSGESVS